MSQWCPAATSPCALDCPSLEPLNPAAPPYLCPKFAPAIAARIVSPSHTGCDCIRPAVPPNPRGLSRPRRFVVPCRPHHCGRRSRAYRGVTRCPCSDRLSVVPVRDKSQRWLQVEGDGWRWLPPSQRCPWWRRRSSARKGRRVPSSAASRMSRPETRSRRSTSSSRARSSAPSPLTTAASPCATSTRAPWCWWSIASATRRSAFR
jgi:hypothetical protein